MLKAETRGPITRIHLARSILGRPLYWVSAYLVDDLLIDTGCPATARELVDWCRDQNVRQVINTHHHEDHSGGDRLLIQELGLPVAAPRTAVPILADFPRLQFYRRAIWGQPRGVKVDPLGNTVETERFRFKVIPTPGHCSDHICLFEPQQGWLFSGDLFVHERVRYLRVDEDPLTTLDSLRRVLALQPQLLICAHFGLVENGCDAIERKIAYWEGVAEQARTLHDEGLPLGEVRDRVLGKEDHMAVFTQGHFSKLNLITALLGENG
jgi:glyoxylase-like metal-dependent hydrolase (beta-lactamase superfamily II)